MNAEAMHDDPLQPGWSGGLNLDVALRRGNVEYIDFGTGGYIQYLTVQDNPEPDALLPWDRQIGFMKQRAMLLADVAYASQDGEAYINQVFVHARYTHMLSPRLGPEIFAQLQLNQFQHLRSRTLLGAGLRFELIQMRPLMLAAGTHLMLEYERIQVQPGFSDPPEMVDIRSTSFLSAHVALPGDRIVVQYTLYVQPRLDDFGDIRVLNELEVKSEVTDAVDFSTKISETVDSRPPGGVRAADLRLLTSLELNF